MSAVTELRRVAVTGVTGFVGVILARRLQQRGHGLNLLLRPGRELPEGIDGDAARPVRGHLGDSEALLRLVGDADAVVHCAGAVRGASAAHFRAVNSDGTHNLAMAFAARNPGGHFVHVSSLAARHPELSWYAYSKRASEARLYASGLERICVLRPPAVYGPGDREMLPLLKMLLAGRALRVSNRHQRLSMLHVEDLARAVVAALENDVTGLYTPEDGAGGHTWDDLCRTAASVSGRRVRTLTLPRSLLSTLATTNLALSRAVGRQPMLTPGKVRELHHLDWSCCADDLVEAAGWQPAIDLSTGLAEVRDGR